MIYIRPEDALHKSYLNGLLIELIDDPILSHGLYFKGGTCAAMLGFLDRFSVDLDFDVKKGADEVNLRERLYKIFGKLDLTVIGEYKKVLKFELKYPNEPGKRNSLKMGALTQGVASNIYAPQYLAEIDRIANCQTIETMFANKLVALTDRFEKHTSIAGRDLYDIHHFFVKGYSYQEPVILERTGLTTGEYFKKLIVFIQAKIPQRLVDEDLNSLLPNAIFQRIRKVLIPETISLLKNELVRLE